MLKSRRYLPPILGLCLLGSALACGDDDKDDDSASDEAALTGDCLEISEACHHADEGEGEAHECHEIAHTAVAADCSEHKEHCIETCPGIEEGDAGAHTH